MQELIILRARNDSNALIGTTDKAKGTTVEIRNMTWFLPHINVSDAARVALLRIVEKNYPIQLPFRSWEMHENPSLSATTRNNWSIMSTTQMEKPRYVIVGFQSSRQSDVMKDNSEFDSISLKDLKLYLNSECYPYTNLNLDTSKGNVALLYNMYVNFQRSYYNRTDHYDVISDRSDFLSKYPIAVIDCSQQNDSLKTGSVDIRLEIETAASVPAGTSCFCLILHDKLMQYSPLTNIVKKL